MPITGREKEHATILSFIKSFIDDTAMNHDRIQSSMFISGSPGTGKTALVTKIVRDLVIEHPDDVQVISINCMALKNPDALWERMLDELEPGTSRKRSTAKKAKGREAVQTLLQKSNLKW